MNINIQRLEEGIYEYSEDISAENYDFLDVKIYTMSAFGRKG